MDRKHIAYAQFMPPKLILQNMFFVQIAETLLEKL